MAHHEKFYELNLFMRVVLMNDLKKVDILDKLEED
jgi:hypothetical protein